jgi:hypothetical protein
MKISLNGHASTKNFSQALLPPGLFIPDFYRFMIIDYRGRTDYLIIS